MPGESKLYIKNMVCDRCIASVRSDLEELKIPFSHVDLGTVKLLEPITGDTKLKLAEILVSQGFELLEDKKSRLIESIKQIVTISRTDMTFHRIFYYREFTIIRTCC